MTVKKIPMRKCTGCGNMFPKKELIRVILTPEGEIELDRTGKKNGRGAYFCADPACVLKAQKGKRLERAFECAVPPEVYESLFKFFASAAQTEAGECKS